MPKLLQVLEDNENPRVQAHAAAALVNFSEECPSFVMELYLQQILLKLQVLIKTKVAQVSFSDRTFSSSSQRSVGLRDRQICFFFLL